MQSQTRNQTGKDNGKIYPMEITNFVFFVELGAVDKTICSTYAEIEKLAM